MKTPLDFLCDVRRCARLLLAAGCLAGLAADALAAEEEASPCGMLSSPGQYGPFDYRGNFPAQRTLVESAHFNRTSEMLIRPMGRNFGGDFDYTLRAFPNHHRALISLARYSERIKQSKLPDTNWTVDCYFERAMRYARDDMLVRMIYAGHLGRTDREAEALAQLDYVASKAADNPFTHYNLGLLYFEIKRYDKALAQAHAALQLGLPRTELRDSLKKVGKWVEPPQAAAPADPAASAAGPSS